MTLSRVVTHPNENMKINAADLQVHSILAMADRMIVLSDEGFLCCDDDGCLLLHGMVRDCAYQLRDAAERELKVHGTKGKRDDAMNNRELYRQKYQAQLDEWLAEVAKLKAKAAGARADARIELNRHVKELDQRMHEAGARLEELATASEEGWDSVSKNVESTWAALKAGVNAATAKFKEEKQLR